MPPTCAPPRRTRCAAPSRQKSARAFLEGRSPGVMQSYAPGAEAGADGWVEDDETVRRLMHWREEAIY